MSKGKNRKGRGGKSRGAGGPKKRFRNGAQGKKRTHQTHQTQKTTDGGRHKKRFERRNGEDAERPPVEGPEREAESSEEETVEDPMKQLLSTFDKGDRKKKDLPEFAAGSSEESDDDEDDDNEPDEIDSNVQNDQDDDGHAQSPLVDTDDNEQANGEPDRDEHTQDCCEPDPEREEGSSPTTEDPFDIHFKDEFRESLLKSLSSVPQDVNTKCVDWPVLGKLVVQIPKPDAASETSGGDKITILEDKTFARPGEVPKPYAQIDWDGFHVKKQIQPNVASANKTNLFKRDCESTEQLTKFQKEIFSVVNNYQDFYYPNRTFTNSEEIRLVYSMHALNHVLKTRTRVLHHNSKLLNNPNEEFRDQGLVRPKVLIIVPFKDSAYRIIHILISLLLPTDTSKVVNKKRFEEEFTGSEILMPKKNPKPEDYELTFAGNSDDTFRIGISVTKKSLKLYSEFYSSDIIIASPLGLRIIVGADGEEERDYDFLSSIEVLILDQTEIFLMQNWDHLLHIFDHLHLQPKKPHGTDFSRLRSWAVNGWTKYYRQTLIFSSLSLPDINAIFNKRCFNYAGKVKVHNPIETGTIRQVAIPIPQVFRRIECKDPISALESRFEVFVSEILPQYKDSIMSHTMIYVPSYFDYVRLRNYFKKEDISFVQICEYSKDSKIARARDMFFHTEAHFLLYSERFHFFRRMRIKGIRHIIFYQPPVFPHFYSELCNLMQEANQNKFGGSESNITVTVLFTKYDLQQISAIVGSERTSRMAQSDRHTHMFMTGD